MLKIFNGTSYIINVYSPYDTVSLYGGRKLILVKGAEPRLIIAPGVNLNVVKTNRDLDARFKLIDLPLVGAVDFTDADVLPEGYDLYVVSNLYRSACKELGRDTSKFATVNGAVHANETAIRPIGCVSLAVG